MRKFMALSAVVAILMISGFSTKLPVYAGNGHLAESDLTNALKDAGLPSDPSQIIGRIFSYSYEYYNADKPLFDPDRTGIMWGRILSVDYGMAKDASYNGLRILRLETTAMTLEYKGNKKWGNLIEVSRVFVGKLTLR